MRANSVTRELFRAYQQIEEQNIENGIHQVHNFGYPPHRDQEALSLPQQLSHSTPMTE